MRRSEPPAGGGSSGRGAERDGQTSYVLSARGPGDYVFKVNEWQAARAGIGLTGFIGLLAADVALPPLS
jgi:hypothetical protein